VKSINWKAIAEFLGATAIVASLIFVGLQLQPERLALLELIEHRVQSPGLQ
jgi:hypothetical protein